MDTHTEAIVRLAWAHRLGLDPDTLAPSGASRVHLVQAGAEALSVLRLGEQTVVVGPHWAVEAAARVDDRDLCRTSTLLRLTADHGARALAEVVLAYTDDYVQLSDLDAAVVTDDPQAVLDLERSCPPDDVTAVGLTRLAARFVLIDVDDSPVAGAGFDIGGGILAELGVLTALRSRRSGHGLRIAALATNAALDEGLVPQWSLQEGHAAAAAIGHRLGFRPFGRWAGVLLPSG
ncbi:hypothetical protein GCM10009841_10250 [Microlunatus panaciterrae]|uniref:N-acetyltransferase domain-containing protein n=1 Tax=Microlunatus panaciterrae TaxID=400768 RepID=A0ABS2RKN8_9ACTN|nr:hypothetical protein [Microlunatus panaciterrae]MBM7799573.1 hypothetical protein [Microlunatus panaciterrae]